MNSDIQTQRTSTGNDSVDSADPDPNLNPNANDGKMILPFVQAQNHNAQMVTPFKNIHSDTTDTNGTDELDGYVNPEPEDEESTLNPEDEKVDDDDDDDEDINVTESASDETRDNTVDLTNDKNNTEEEENEKSNENKNKNGKSNENKNKNRNGEPITTTETEKSNAEGNTDTDSTVAGDGSISTKSSKSDIINNKLSAKARLERDQLMSFYLFKKWDLEHPPKLVSQFWMEHPKVVVEAMKHWIYADITVPIPYRWNAVDYSCTNMCKEPRKAKKGEHYIEMTMIQVVDLCEAFIRHPRTREHKKFSGDEKYVKYSPIIVKSKSELVAAELQVKKTTADVLSVDRAAKEAEGGDPNYLKKIRLLACKGKRKLVKLKQIRDNCSRNLRFAVETIQTSVTLAAEKATNEKQSVNDKARLQQLFDTWNDDDDELSSALDDQTNDTPPSLKTTNSKDTRNKGINGSITIERNPSQVSELTSKTNQVPAAIDDEPAFTIADVEYSPCTELKDKYINFMNDNIDIDHKHVDVTVLLLPETMCVLTHSTKEITKIESNELQQSELRRWNSACKLEIHQSKGVFVKCLRNRPTIIPIDALKNDSKVNNLETQLDHTVKQFQVQAQAIINEYTELEVQYMEKKRRLDLETSLKKIIRSHTTYILHQDMEKQRIKNVLSRDYGNSVDTSLDEACGFTYLLLLTGKACTALTEWTEENSTVNMMNALTTTLAVPQRLTEKQVQERAKGTTLRIGNMTFLCPNKDVWSLAQESAEGLHDLVAEISLGMKTKFYKKIIESKGNHAVRELRYTTSTIDMTAKVSNVLLHAADTETKLNISRYRKKMIQSAVDILVKRNKGIKSSSAALKSKNKTINEKPAALKSKNKTTNEKPNAVTTNLKNPYATPVSAKNPEINKSKKAEKTNSLNKNDQSTIQKTAAKEKSKRQQQQQQQQDETSSITSRTSFAVAATQREQRKEQQFNQHRQQHHQHQQPRPYQQRANFDYDNDYNNNNDYEYEYNNNNYNHEPYHGRGRGRGRGRGGRGGRGGGRGYMPSQSSSGKRYNEEYDNYDNHKRSKNY